MLSFPLRLIFSFKSLQKNFPVATKLLKELHKEAKTNRGWLLRWVHCFSSYGHKRSLGQGPVERIGSILKTIPLLGNINNLPTYEERLSEASCILLSMCRGAGGGLSERHI